jgi:membrane fusion protein (multidrug efflux system)
VIVLLAGSLLFLRTGGESTDDAFVDGRSISVAPKVAGWVRVLSVNDNQKVHAGDLLMRLDARDFEVARDFAAAALASDRAQLASARANLSLAETTYRNNLTSVGAALKEAEAAASKADADLKRQRRVDPRATSEQNLDAAIQAAATTTAQVADAQAKLNVAQAGRESVEMARAAVSQLTAVVQGAEAALRQAELNLSYTEIRAPADGRVTKRAVEAGSYVQVGQAVLSLVNPEVWVTANFKESQLPGVAPGASVRLRIDAYPSLKLSGHVDSIQYGTGGRFTAFPPENATGNFVKIVQRVPVKIVFDAGERALAEGLPLGLSVIPTVDR